MIEIVTMIWDPNRKSQSFSQMYTDEWVEKLRRGFQRNLSLPHRFVCYTDRERRLHPDIEQVMMNIDEPDYSCYLLPFERNVPMILCGLDTIVTAPVDHLAVHCIYNSMMVLPRDPYNKVQSCNGVALVPGNHRFVLDSWCGLTTDMEHLRTMPHLYSDDLYPGQIRSYKGSVRDEGMTSDTCIVYFHGDQKPHQLGHVDFVREHWF